MILGRFPCYGAGWSAQILICGQFCAFQRRQRGRFDPRYQKRRYGGDKREELTKLGFPWKDFWSWWRCARLWFRQVLRSRQASRLFWTSRFCEDPCSIGAHGRAVRTGRVAGGVVEIEIVRRTLSFRLLCFSCFWCGALRLLGGFVRIGQFELTRTVKRSIFLLRACGAAALGKGSSCDARRGAQHPC